MSVVAFATRRPLTARVLTSAPVALLWLLFAVANFSNWRTTHRPTGLGATALELVVATLFVIRRTPWVVSRSPRAWTAAAIGTFGEKNTVMRTLPLMVLRKRFVLSESAYFWSREKSQRL